MSVLLHIPFTMKPLGSLLPYLCWKHKQSVWDYYKICHTLSITTVWSNVILDSKNETSPMSKIQSFQRTPATPGFIARACFNHSINLYQWHMVKSLKDHSTDVLHLLNNIHEIYLSISWELCYSYIFVLFFLFSVYVPRIFGLTSSTLWQSCDCRCVSKVTLTN